MLLKILGTKFLNSNKVLIFVINLKCKTWIIIRTHLAELKALRPYTMFAFSFVSNQNPPCRIESIETCPFRRINS
jgi:hypothetical protein